MQETGSDGRLFAGMRKGVAGQAAPQQRERSAPKSGPFCDRKLCTGLTGRSLPVAGREKRLLRRLGALRKKLSAKDGPQFERTKKVG